MPFTQKNRKGRRTRRNIANKTRKMKPNYRKVTNVGQVKKVVNRVLSKKIETQMETTSWNLTPLCLQNTTGTLANNVVVLNPSNASIGGWSLAQGTEDNDMKGAKVQMKSCNIKYVITLEPYNATTNPLNGKPCLLRYYIFKNKKIPQNDLAVTNICGNGVNANVFEAGNSNIGFIGNLEDYIQKLNPERYRYLAHRTFKLGNSIQANTTLGVGNPIYAQSNNDFRMSYYGTIPITKYLQKTATRDDDAVFCDDYVFMLFQVVYADGTTATNVTAPVRVRMELDYKYTDA